MLSTSQREKFELLELSYATWITWRSKFRDALGNAFFNG